MEQEKFIEALHSAVRRAGSQKNFAAEAAMPQSRISEYLNGRRHVDTISCGLLSRLFPKARIVYSGASEEELPALTPQEKILLEHFRKLSPAEQAECLILFGGKWRK